MQERNEPSYDEIRQQEIDDEAALIDAHAGQWAGFDGYRSYRQQAIDDEANRTRPVVKGLPDARAKMKRVTLAGLLRKLK